MYFLDGRGQGDIASVLGTSRSNVSRMLSAARQQGLVEIRVQEPHARDRGLEQALRERFGLTEVQVAAFNPGAEPPLEVGELAAKWLKATVRSGQVLALSAGAVVNAMVDATFTADPRSVEVIPLVGGLSVAASEVGVQELVRELARRLGGSHRYLHAPAVLGSSTARDALLDEPAIKATFDRVGAADLAVVGVGFSQQLVDAFRLTSAQLDAFEAAGPVGDICYRFYDADGHAIGGAAHDRVLAVTLDQLKRIPAVVGVVAGREKAPALLGALRGRIINGLITDAGLAHAVLDAVTDSAAPCLSRPTGPERRGQGSRR
jgi:DNA-binding transcriptional regulator LsrR (DeoR family)